MTKKTHRQPSRDTLRNDRGNHLGNAQNHLHLTARIAKKFADSGINSITDQDIFRLLELTDKCANTLKKYINARNFMGKDELITAISSELGSNPRYEEFDNETRWLSSKFGELCVKNCQDFIQSEIEADIQSVNVLYKQIIAFREQFKRICESVDIVRDNFQRYIDESLRIAIGTALVCEDGLKYYKQTGFSVRSIWLGSRMFLAGTESLLDLGKLGEM